MYIYTEDDDRWMEAERAAREWLQDVNDKIQKARIEVAREIFEEIEILMKIYTFPVVQRGVVEIAKEPFWCIEPNDFAAIKKKYTEEKKSED